MSDVTANTCPIPATVLLSGGLDSLCVTNFMLSRGFQVDGLFVDYGQRSAALEHQASEAIASFFGIQYRCVSVNSGSVFAAGEVRGRNLFLLATSLTFADANSGVLAIGIHAGTPYFDCSKAFIEDADRLIRELTDCQRSVLAPFVRWTKLEIFDYALTERLPISLTYSCEAGTMPPCGECLSCLDIISLNRLQKEGILGFQIMDK